MSKYSQADKKTMYFPMRSAVKEETQTDNAVKDGEANGTDKKAE